MAIITGTNRNDYLRGTSQRDTVWGLEGADTFYWSPGLGNDTIHGGRGSEGYDTNIYMDKRGGDRLFLEGSRDVTLQFTTTADGTASGGGQQMTFTGIERIHLGSGNDRIFAANATLAEHGLTIYAGAGNDSIQGTRYDDYIDGGSGHDTIAAGAGNDHIQSSTGNDSINGGGGNDNIRWGQGNFQEVVGNDTIDGGSGSDLINVWIKDGYNANGRGVQVEVNGSVDGQMRLTASTDIGGARSTLTANNFELGWTHEGRDTVSGANAILTTNAGMNWNTRWGDDILTGTRGNDTLEGGEGRDRIRGGAGDDIICAGSDYWAFANARADGVRDILVFRGNFGNDTVVGFDRGLDVIDLGGRSYIETQTAEGLLWTVGDNSIIFM